MPYYVFESSSKIILENQTRTLCNRDSHRGSQFNARMESLEGLQVPCYELKEDLQLGSS